MTQHASPFGTDAAYAVTVEPRPHNSQTGTPSNIAALPAALHDARAAEQLAGTMKLVKSARFNAAERLERKQKVSLAAQSIVALYFIGVAVFQAVYIGQIDDATNRLLTFIQIVSSVFTLILGLLEALNDYQLKAHHLSNCALTVAELAQDLRIANTTNKQTIQDYRRRYNEALKACPVNHTRLDYQFALLDGKGDKAAWAAVYARYMIDVYGLYALFLSVPPLLWWMHR